MKIKQVYGDELEKLLLFRGDWHTLANFQPVLNENNYYTAGLKEIAVASGYCGETLTALSRCSHFKRVHASLLQAWQAIYKILLVCFCEHEASYQAAFIDFIDAGNTFTEKDFFIFIEPMMANAGNVYIEQLSTRDDTWKFWCQFVFKDCLSYIALYLAIRCKNWKLHLSALKMMAPLFAA